MSIPGQTTQYGFEYGAATVERTCSDERKGWVYISVHTTKRRISIYVTKSGKIRVFDDPLAGNAIGTKELK